MFKPPRIESERRVLSWPTATQMDQYYEDTLCSDMFNTFVWDGPTGPEDLPSYWKERCFSRALKF